MTRYVALFRGINVGKAKRIAMADLRALLEKQGFGDVATLLNSGNAVFTANRTSCATLAGTIRAAVAKQLGVDAAVLVKSAAEVAGIMRGNALEKIATDPSRLLVAMAPDARALVALRPVAGRDWGRERVHVGEHAAYIWCADGILESKALTDVLKALGGTGTTRNWATLGRIHALMNGS